MDFLVWTFGDGSSSNEFQPSHFYSAEGVYDVALYVVSDKGCMDTLILTDAVIAESGCKMIFPNAFAPAKANRSENRRFKPIHQGVSDYQLEIYNQWGELLYVSNDIEEGWDGMYRGELSKLDVYVWKAHWTCINGEEFDDAGDVTLLR